MYPHNHSLIVTQSQEQRAQLASLVDFDPGYLTDVPTIAVTYVANRPHPGDRILRVEWMSRPRIAEPA